MNNWCFIDESWHEGDGEHIGVLAAVVCPWATHEALTREVFRLNRKYYGDAHARDHRRELKGRELLSNSSLKIAEKLGYSKNLTIVRELLEFAHQQRIRIAAGAIYGPKPPPLLSPDPKLLAPPFRGLCNRVLAQLPKKADGVLVFDQRLGAQEDISISIHNYLAGIEDNDRVRSLPLLAVSNVCAGLQLADIVAFIVGRYSSGDDRFSNWYRMVSRLQINAIGHKKQRIYGFYRQQWNPETNEYSARKNRGKKEEPGASGKEAS